MFVLYPVDLLSITSYTIYEGLSAHDRKGWTA